MFNLNNIKPITQVCVSLLLSMGLLCFLGMALPLPGIVNTRQLPIGWGNIERYAQKVSTLEQIYKQGLINQKKLGFILGQSNVREGFDPKLISRLFNFEIQWIVFTGSGGSLEKMEYLSKPLFLSQISPDIVVLCITPSMLIGQPNPDYGKRIDFKQIALAFISGKFKDGYALIAQRNWILSKRRQINDSIKHLLYQVRLFIFKQFSLGPEMLFKSSQRIDVFAADPKWYKEPRAKKAHLDRQVFYWKLFKWFSPDKYRSDGNQAKALFNLIDNFKKKNTKIILLLMPEASFLREHIPIEAFQTLKEILKNKFPNDFFPLMDMRDSVPDEFFYDFGHMNIEGRDYFSKLFAERMKKAISIQ